MTNLNDKVYIENNSKHKTFSMSSYHLNFLTEMVTRDNDEPVKITIVIEDIKE